MSWNALRRPVSVAGLLVLSGMLVSPFAGAAEPVAGVSSSRQSLGNVQSCTDPANGWTGRVTVRANSAGSGGGNAMVACFPDQASCQRWLGKASGGARGVILVMRCEAKGGS